METAAVGRFEAHGADYSLLEAAAQAQGLSKSGLLDLHLAD